MGIIHRRNTEITYNGRIEETIFGKLSEQLHKRGMSLVDSFTDEIKENHYGFNEVSEDAVQTFAINNITICAEDWGNRPKKMFGLVKSVIGDDANYTLTLTESSNTYNKWVLPKGDIVHFTNEAIEGEVVYEDYNMQLRYEQEHGYVFMKVEVERNTYNLQLRFTIKYVSNAKLLPAEIRTYLEDVPLKDMKWIKSMFETRCMLKAISYDTSDFTIDCDYKVIASSTQECSPATVAKLMGEEE